MNANSYKVCHSYNGSLTYSDFEIILIHTFECATPDMVHTEDHQFMSIVECYEMYAF